MINGWIMSGDTAVASFHGRVVTPILPERCPLCFQKGGDLEMWLESRAIDRHRTNSRILKRILRLGDTSDLNTALHVHGATITDNYWVKTEDEANLTWADVGFRENYFADLALSGRFSSIAKNYTPKELRTATPELTNIGSYEKCWRQKSGHWIMVKSGMPEEHFSRDFHGGDWQAPRLSHGRVYSGRCVCHFNGFHRWPAEFRADGESGAGQ